MKTKTLPQKLLRATYKAQNAIANASVGLDLAADDLEAWWCDNGDRMAEGDHDALSDLIDRLRHIAEQVNELDTDAMEAIDHYTEAETGAE
jgi:hypothetical protein